MPFIRGFNNPCPSTLYIQNTDSHFMKKNNFSFLYPYTTHCQRNNHQKHMQGSRCLYLEVQIISARKDSVQTLGELQLSFKARQKETRQCLCNHQTSTKCLHCEQTVSWEQRFKLSVPFCVISMCCCFYVDFSYLKESPHLSIAEITFFVCTF